MTSGGCSPAVEGTFLVTSMTKRHLQVQMHDVVFMHMLHAEKDLAYIFAGLVLRHQFIVFDDFLEEFSTGDAVIKQSR